mmetsp:Transcript_968/g.1372  ORF Transcript_968/g.1372 Transcript_968/m.1372 type:complete len:183 (+) Transcript_968:30-578(+)
MEAKSSDPESREIGNEAAWTLSSAKPGNGVDQLRDGNFETFWQSDGVQPHLINIQFYKKMRIKELKLYCDFKRDESYTPNKISIRAGTGFHDLREVQQVELDEPDGWISAELCVKASDSGGTPSFLRAHVVQIAILSSHQNGRDTHVRQVKIYGPRQASTKGFGTELTNFETVDFLKFYCVR